MYLSVGVWLYGFALGLVPRLGEGVELSPSFGLGLVTALLWSIAWDRRSGRIVFHGARAEPKWPKIIVALASVSTIVSILAAALEIQKR